MNSSVFENIVALIEADDVVGLNGERIDVQTCSNHRDQNERTLLQLAIHAGSTNAVLWLLDAKLGGPVNAADNQGETALMRAASLGDRPVIEELLRSGGDLKAKANSGGTALHYAYSGGKQAAGIPELLIERGADRGALDAQQRLPEAWAEAAAMREAGEAMLKAASGPVVQRAAKHIITIKR
jgi:ankyrin repeat protein